MSLWKKILLRSAGFGAGFALTICAIVGVLLWYQERPTPPKSWNKQAIIAEYDGLSARGSDNNIVFDYTLQNNTDDDFRLDTDVGVNLTAKLQQHSQFAQFSQTSFTLKYPVFVPAKNRVRLSIESKLKYPLPALKADATSDDRKQYGNALARWITDERSNLDGFVIFDTIDRFEIDFPAGWENTSKDTSADKR